MSLSRRNRFVGIYGYSNTGTEGVVNDTWTLSGSHFARLDDTTGKTVLHGGAADMRVDAVIELSDQITVPSNGVIVLDGAPVSPITSAYHVRSIIQRPDLHAQLVYCERLHVDASALLLDGSFILDGSQVLAGVTA